MRRRKRLPDLPAPHGSLMAAVEGYLETCRVLGHSEGTLYSRRYPLYHFCAFAYERGVMKPGEVTSPMLARYQAKLYHSRKKDGSPVSFVTQASHLTALKMFFKWLSKQGLLRHNPAADMEMPKMGRRLPRATLTVTEVETLLSLPDLNTPVGLRDRAILEVFYSTAMRRGELARLLLSDSRLRARPGPYPRGQGQKGSLCAHRRAGASVDQKVSRGWAAASVPRPRGEGTVPVQGRETAVSGNPHPKPSALLRFCRLREKGLLSYLPPQRGHLDAGRRGGHPLHPADAGA